MTEKLIVEYEDSGMDFPGFLASCHEEVVSVEKIEEKPHISFEELNESYEKLESALEKLEDAESVQELIEVANGVYMYGQIMDAFVLGLQYAEEVEEQ